MTAKIEEPTRYRVTAPYITVKTASVGGLIPGAKGGYAVIGLHRDAHLPPDVAPETLEHLLSQGMIEEL
jgi:hypothetical protein